MSIIQSNSSNFQETIRRHEAKKYAEETNAATLDELQRRAKADARKYYRRQRQLLAVYYRKVSKGAGQ